MSVNNHQIKKYVATAAAATIAFVAGPWGDLVAPAFGILVVATCIAATLFVYLLWDRLDFFGFSKNTSPHDRRYVAIGLILITATLVSSFGIFTWMQFPREMTPVERLSTYYLECREIEKRGREVSDDKLEDYQQEFREWHQATIHYIRQNLSGATVERFQAPPNALTSVIRQGNPAKRLASATRNFCANLESIIENDEWRTENT